VFGGIVVQTVLSTGALADMQIAWRNSIIDPATGRSEMWEPQKEPGFRLFATKHLQTRLVFVPSFCVQLFAGLVWL